MAEMCCPAHVPFFTHLRRPVRSAGARRAILPSGIAVLASACMGASACLAAAPQPGQSAAAQGSGLSEVQALISSVRTPDTSALAEALGVSSAATKVGSIDPTTYSLQVLGDLDGDNVPEVALNRLREPSGVGLNQSIVGELTAWELFLLSWDGSRWRVTHMKEGFEPYELQVVSSLVPGSRQIAVVEYQGAKAVPHPAIYQVKDHAPSLLWDSEAGETQYEGYAQGKIEFREPQGGGPPEMIASGRADPGLIQFPKDGKRGFDVRAVYGWDGKSYLPGKTEYSDNEDYRLYRFISALDLHDFRAAYALIDPAKFMSSDAPSLAAFQKYVENTWPEFLGDQIFEVHDSGAIGDFTFELIAGDEGARSVYFPSFGSDSKHLLIGLERRDEASQQ